MAAAAAASSIALFTREGRQIAGTPLTEAEAAALLTVANGFDADAVYSTDGLGTASGAPQVSREGALGDYALALPASTGFGLSLFESGTLPAEKPARNLSVNVASGPVDVLLPAGASAAWAAEVLGDALPLSASAETRMALTLPATGTLSFEIAGTNTAASTVSVNLATGGPFALASEINRLTPSTGVRAEVSSDGSRFELVHGAGADITLSNIAHTCGAPIPVARLDPMGTSLEAGTLGGPGQDAVRVSGVVTLTGAADFSLLEGAATAAAQRAEFTNGHFDLARSAAGSALLLKPAPPGGDDLALRQVTFIGADGRPRDATADPALAGSQSLAEGLAASLRASSPASRLTGAPLASLPPEDARLVVWLGTQDYTVTMRGGLPSVDGPEPGRVTARFDGANQLIVETDGGHLDGAALQLVGAAGDATLFGMGPAEAPTTTVIGQPFNVANLPSSFTVTVGGVSHAVTVNATGVVLPPTFPATGFINTAFGRVEIEFDAREGAFAIPADSAAADAGFDTMGATADIQSGALALSATDGRNLEVASLGAQEGVTLRLSNLPNEDLITVLSGAGANRLSGTITAGDTADRERELRILDANAGLVGLFDAETDTQLAVRTLDAAGSARIGELEFTLQGLFSDGDTYTVAPNSGFAAAFAALQQNAGAEVATGEIRQATASAALEGAQREVSALRDVDLDEEAARLVQQQQSYQANAQVINVARTMFDTLLQSL